jgi:hypothetical protein
MSGSSDPRWDDPRDPDGESRDVEVHWIELGRGPTSDRQSEEDTGDRDHDGRDHDSRERGRDPRGVFMDGLELPRGLRTGGRPGRRSSLPDQWRGEPHARRKGVRFESSPSGTGATHGDGSLGNIADELAHRSSLRIVGTSIARHLHNA